MVRQDGAKPSLRLAIPSPLEEVLDDRLTQAGVRLLLKRDDLIHPELPGNKWRKLKYNVVEAIKLDYGTLLTFGGAYSNHLRAVAAVGKYFNLATIGLVRGDELANQNRNWSLQFAEDCGMHLEFLDRNSYRRKSDPVFVAELHDKFGNFHYLPEGGSNNLGVLGAREITREVDVCYSAICCGVGTGGTLAGIAAGTSSGQRAIGFSALKGGAFLNQEVENLQIQTFGHRVGIWTIELEYHFGGFAKRSIELDKFLNYFRSNHDIDVDWIYVGKMLYGIYQMVSDGKFAQGEIIIAVITGSPEADR